MTTTLTKKLPPAILEVLRLANEIEATVLPGGTHETKGPALKLAALVKTLLAA